MEGYGNYFILMNHMSVNCPVPNVVLIMHLEYHFMLGFPSNMVLATP